VTAIFDSIAFSIIRSFIDRGALQLTLGDYPPFTHKGRHRGHYAETLRLWRMRFLDRRAAMRRLYDARFVRMWKFYLVGCEYFFRRQHGMVLQLQHAKDQMAAPISRHYIRNRKNEFKDRLWTLHLSGNLKPLPR
jgi:hypothetical protein